MRLHVFRLSLHDWKQSSACGVWSLFPSITCHETPFWILLELGQHRFGTSYRNLRKRWRHSFCLFSGSRVARTCRVCPCVRPLHVSAMCPQSRVPTFSALFSSNLSSFCLMGLPLMVWKVRPIFHPEHDWTTESLVGSNSCPHALLGFLQEWIVFKPVLLIMFCLP